MAVRPYVPSDDAAIERLNERFRAAGVPHVQYRGTVPETSTTLPRETLYVVSDGEEIRGGAFLREFPALIGGVPVVLGSVKLPLSESVIDRSFSTVPAALILQLSRVQPNLIAIGMGGHGGVFAQFLARLRWTGDIVATFLCPLHAHKVLPALPHVQRNPTLRRVSRILHMFGADRAMSLVFPAMLGLLTRRHRAGLTVHAVDVFPAEVDSIAMGCRAAYNAGVERTAAVLNWLYPRTAPDVERFLVRRSGKLIGWFAVQTVDLRPLGGRSPFGPITVAFILDGLAEPGDAHGIIAHSLRAAARSGADLIIANHTHPAWQTALRRCGFLRGPERFAFYRSPATEKLFTSHGVEAAQMFLSRGDDGFFVGEPAPGDMDIESTSASR